jgi:hypothetical protein
MAETTDRPQRTEDAPSYEAAPPATESYRPLSLLALGGFGLAVLYALIVVIGGLVALVARVPWLMPGWTFVLPLAALVVCWLARVRIRDSENTLSGSAFTTWGFRITILVGVSYAAYYGATFFVVRSQAIDFANQVFEPLKQDHPNFEDADRAAEKSFLLAYGVPLKDVDDNDLRTMLEVKFNSPMGTVGGAGQYTRYRQSEFVRLIEMAGSDAQILPLGVVDWEYADRGYRVVLRYHVVTPLADFDMSVETFRRDPNPGESRGPQWQIPLAKGGMRVLADSLKPSEHGVQSLQKSKMAQTFASDWIDKVNRGQWAEAYADTLPPSERSRLEKSYQNARLSAAAPMAGAAVLGLYDSASRDALSGRYGGELDKLIRLDKKTFWAGKEQRALIVQRIQHSFRLGADGSPSVNPRLQESMPWIREKDGQTTVALDLGVNYLDESGMKPQYIVEGRLLVTAKDSDADRLPSAWRIAAVEMVSGRTPAPMMPGGGRPPGGQP